MTDEQWLIIIGVSLSISVIIPTIGMIIINKIMEEDNGRERTRNYKIRSRK